MQVLKIEKIQSLLITIGHERVLLDRDVAELYGIETKRVNEAVKNNQDRFPVGYIVEVDKEVKNELVENFDRFKTLKHSTSNPKAFTEKGIYMLATILTTKKAVETTIHIIETFSKVKELSKNINKIMNTTNGEEQKQLAQQSNILLEDIIEIEPEILNDDHDGELVETTTKFEFNLGFAKVSRSIKKVR
ncbi:MAG: ORF6N domain-containing protein [Campylobacterota bacterium]|nr:ORF6N domain-containing protein [Campylobacterota bacterium]